LIVLDFLYKSKALHYGYWEPTDEVQIWNFGKAQERYTNNLLRHVPADAKDVLDVGCGTGIVAKRLIEAGHNVECLSPSPILNSEARKILPSSTPVLETTFEEFKTGKKYDLILFVESFQYVNMQESFAKFASLLKPGGRILICDVFRLDTPGRSPIGGGRNYNEYLRLRDSYGLTCVKDIDITANIAPTFDLVQELSLNLLKPAWQNLLRIVRGNHPIIGKFLLWLFRKKIQKMDKHFQPGRNAKGFTDYKTCRIQLLRLP
jgi:cyclopropane fatty-acyl-phospholipid synthase-like methyltransferase